MICESCGLEKEDARERVDPFLREVWDEEKLIILCNECLSEQM